MSGEGARRSVEKEVLWRLGRLGGFWRSLRVES